MDNTIYQIYDKMFKKILTLSSKAVINLINGLFEENYPPNSEITYNWTEFEDQELKRILADTIITIAGKYSYHLEAQMTEDDEIILRVFEYGFSHAFRNSVRENDLHILPFPEVRIIYLCAGNVLPDHYILLLDFGSQGTFTYEAPTIKLQNISTTELNQKKMIILIPFTLLRLRDSIAKERTPENLNALKKLIQDDIIGSIEENLRLGNISLYDARRLKQLTHKLYRHIYAHYHEMETEGINEMTDESMMLEIDIIEKEHEKEIELIKKQIIDEKNKELKEKDWKLKEKEAEIAALKKKLEQFT